jgi:hypothetical protein
MITQRLKVEKDQAGNSTGNIVKDDSSQFIAWGYNYTRPRGGLIEDLWETNLTSIEADFDNIKTHGNIVRICLQINKFMNSISGLNTAQFDKLVQLLDFAAQKNLYVIITGSNTWKIADQPTWLTELNENDRWLVQANFWKEIARRVSGHPAVAWYNLINKPIDQNINFEIASASINTDDNTIDFVFQNVVDIIDTNLELKWNRSGYAIISSSDRQQIAYLKYSSVVYDANLAEDGETALSYTISLIGCIKEKFGNYNIMSANSGYISFIDKEIDITGNQISNINSAAKTATIDLNSAFQSFKTTELDNKTIAGFVGNTYSAALIDVNQPTGGGDDFQTSTLIGIQNINDRYSKTICSNYNLVENNHAVYGSSLNNDGQIGNIPLGYGQVLNPYNISNNQYYLPTYYNSNKINFVNFGLNDFISNGKPYGLNSKFFIQTFRVILSRLRASSVTEFTNSNFTGSTTVTKISASGGSYQKTTTNKTGASAITFSTPSNFTGGTVAIGFMVENGADATAQITVNDRSYFQSLKSGVDTLSGITAPVVKRINSLPSGVNTFTISLTVNSATSACLDYWQIESNSPAPIIVHSIIDYEKEANVSTLNKTYNSGAIDLWNNAICNLVYGEFFDGSIAILDCHEALSRGTSSPDECFGNDNFNLNQIGHFKIAVNCATVFNYHEYLIDNFYSDNGQYTYLTQNEHNLQVGDIVVIKGASPAALNGAFRVNATTSPNAFSISNSATVTNPSITSASYAKCLLKPNKPYFINAGSNIPNDIVFITDSIAGSNNVTANGRYNIQLSSNAGVTDNSALQNCVIKTPLIWSNIKDYVDQTGGVYYSTYITLTPNGRSNKTIATNWINAIKAAIKIYDLNTPITVGTTYVDSDGAVSSGFGFSNTQSLLDIISPHQYIIDSVSDAVNGIAKCASQNQPVVLEEGAVPYQNVNLSTNYSQKITANYLTKSKQYIAGALSDYRADSAVIASGTPTKNNYDLFVTLAPWMNDYPMNNSTNIANVNSYYWVHSQSIKDNKPRVIGTKSLIPIGDLNVRISDVLASSSSGNVSPGTYQYAVSALLADGTETVLYPDDNGIIEIIENKNIAISWLPDPSIELSVLNYCIYKYKTVDSGGTRFGPQWWRIGETVASTTSFTDSNTSHYGRISGSQNNPTWSANINYRTGDYTRLSGVTYQAISNIAAGQNPPPNATHWTANATATSGITTTSSTLRLDTTEPVTLTDLPSSGVVLVNGEYIKYEGTYSDGGTPYLINLTRGFYNTTPQASSATAVYPLPNKNFEFVEKSSTTPTNRFNLPKIGSYIAQSNLFFDGNDSYAYLNTSTPINSNIDLNFNNFKLTKNQSLASNNSRTVVRLGGSYAGPYNNLITASPLSPSLGVRHPSWTFNYSGLSGSDMGSFDVCIDLPINASSLDYSIYLSSLDTTYPSGTNNVPNQGFFRYVGNDLTNQPFANRSLRYRGLYAGTGTASTWQSGDIFYYNGTVNAKVFNGFYQIWGKHAIALSAGTATPSDTGGYFDPIQTNCSGSTGSNTLTGLSSTKTANMVIGMLVTGSSAVQSNTVITAKPTSTSVTLSKPLTANISTTTLSFRGWTAYQLAPVTSNNRATFIVSLKSISGSWSYLGGYYGSTNQVQLPDVPISNPDWFAPNNWRLGVYNAGSNVDPSVANPSIKNFKYNYGSDNASGTEIMYTQTKGVFLPVNSGKVSLTNSAGSNVLLSSSDFTANDTTYSSFNLSFIANDDTSYVQIDSRNVNIFNAKVDVKVSETLATKGTPIATIV